jgi:hypothetical protein
MRIAGAVKNFLWSACNNLLPTKENLFKKWIVQILYALFAVYAHRLLARLFGAIPRQRHAIEKIQKITTEESDVFCAYSRSLWENNHRLLAILFGAIHCQQMYGWNAIEKIQKITIEENDVLCLFQKLMGKLDEEELELVATLARRVWFCINPVVYGGAFTHPFQSVKSAKDMVEEFHQATQVSEWRK